MESHDNTEPKKIEVITGNGDLNISPVYKHLEVEKPKPKENHQKIFIPEVKNTPTNKEKSSSEDTENTENDEK